MKPLKITISKSESGWTAVCSQFSLMGGGETKEEALGCMALCLRSHFKLFAKKLEESDGFIENIADIATV
jgi:hypothetical protein